MHHTIFLVFCYYTCVIPNLFFYLFRFYFYDFHRKYFRALYRLSMILSHQFGIVAMIKNLFSLFFGFPGIFSKINGFVIRSIAIVISTMIVFAGFFIGLGIYFVLISSIPYLFVKSFWIAASLALDTRIIFECLSRILSKENQVSLYSTSSCDIAFILA